MLKRFSDKSKAWLATPKGASAFSGSHRLHGMSGRREVHPAACSPALCSPEPAVSPPSAQRSPVALLS